MTSERHNRERFRVYVGRNRNIYGEKVQRPREEYPYSFDHYCIYKTTDFEQTTHTIYSDRMRLFSVMTAIISIARIQTLLSSFSENILIVS